MRSSPGFTRNEHRSGPARRLVVWVLASACAVVAGAQAPVTALPGEARAGTVADIGQRFSDQDGDGLTDWAELGRAAMRRPALAPLTTGLARRNTEPVPLLFLGSSTTYGVGASTPALRYVDQLVGRLQRSFPASVGREIPTRDLRSGTQHPNKIGVRGVNGGVGGATAATYFSDAHAWGVHVVQPTCVVHMVGSNDSVARVPTATYEAQVRAAIRRIDSLSARPPCHVLVHSLRRYQVTVQSWAEYGAALRRVAEDRRRVTVVDVAGEFESRDALGSDPDNLVGSDGFHLTDAGHTLLADLVHSALDITRRDLGTGTDPSRADTDRDGLRDGRELAGYVIHQRTTRCSGTVITRTRTRSLPYDSDTDGDALLDGREVRGYRLWDGRLVRTDPSRADTDEDGRGDGREASAPGADPTRCR